MKPSIEIAGARVFLGDCVEVMRSLPDNSVDSIVTDPPYGLEFMGKDWDAPWKKSGNFAGNIEPTSDSAGGVSAYASARVRYSKGSEAMVGFQLWATEWAVECLRVLKPGGHILAFGGSRTWHRLAVAVEDAGFELRDSIAWIYGSGFPKSLDVSKAIDKRLGADGTTDKVLRMAQGNARKTADGSNTHLTKPMSAHENANKELVDTPIFGYEPATPEAQKWQGWGTALKPAFEPVVVGRKPLVGTVAENVLLWGVGGLNIDGSRIAGAVGGWNGMTSNRDETHFQRFTKSAESRPVEGRWPANVILDEVTAGLLDEQSGVTSAKPRIGGVPRKQSKHTLSGYGENRDSAVMDYGDSGGASRFFYVAKASKRDRNEGLEDLEGKLPAFGNETGDGLGRGISNTRQDVPRQNFHPTVKPTQLMRYLIKLVTPAGGTVLDPFTGSGSTGKAALLDGYQFIGAELTEEYLPIIEGRLRWASEQEGEDDDTLF